MRTTYRKVRLFKRRSAGSVMDMMTVGVFVIAMTVLMMAYLSSISLLDDKAQISQISRKYILRMETVGYLTDNDRVSMTQELMEMGVTDIDFSGSTMNQVNYGEAIVLVIRGKIGNESVSVGANLWDSVFSEQFYEFEKRQMSTAKN